MFKTGFKTASCFHVRHFVVIQMFKKFILDIVFRHLHRQEALLFVLVTLGRVNISKPKSYIPHMVGDKCFWVKNVPCHDIIEELFVAHILLFNMNLSSSLQHKPKDQTESPSNFFFSSKRHLLPCAQWFIFFSECYAALSPFWLWPRACIQQSVVCPAAQPQRPSLYLPDRDPIPVLDPQSPPFIFN